MNDIEQNFSFAHEHLRISLFLNKGLEFNSYCLKNLPIEKFYL